MQYVAPSLMMISPVVPTYGTIAYRQMVGSGWDKRIGTMYKVTDLIDATRLLT